VTVLMAVMMGMKGVRKWREDEREALRDS